MVGSDIEDHTRRSRLEWQHAIPKDYITRVDYANNVIGNGDSSTIRSSPKSIDEKSENMLGNIEIKRSESRMNKV